MCIPWANQPFVFGWFFFSLSLFHPPSLSLVRRISLVLKWFDPSHQGRRSPVTMVPAFLEKAMKCVNAAPVKGVSTIWSDSVCIIACYFFLKLKSLLWKNWQMFQFKFVILTIHQERRGALQASREAAWMWRNKGPRGPKIQTEREISSSSQREESLSCKADNTRITLRYL